MRKIAQTLKVPVAALFGEVVAEDGAPYGRVREVALPIVGSVNAMEIDNNIIYEEEPSGEMVKFRSTECALVVHGNSMSPIVEDGQVVMFDRDTPPKDGDLCVAKIRKGKHKGVYFKRYQDIGKGMVVLNSVGRTGKPIAVRKTDAEFYLVTGAKYLQHK